MWGRKSGQSTLCDDDHMHFVCVWVWHASHHASVTCDSDSSWMSGSPVSEKPMWWCLLTGGILLGCCCCCLCCCCCWLSHTISIPGSSSSSEMSNWNLLGSVAPQPPLSHSAPSPSCSPPLSLLSLLLRDSEGEMGIMFWYQSRLSSKASSISWQSGWTRSAHVSHSGCTM